MHIKWRIPQKIHYAVFENWGENSWIATLAMAQEKAETPEQPKSTSGELSGANKTRKHYETNEPRESTKNFHQDHQNEG